MTTVATSAAPPEDLEEGIYWLDIVAMKAYVGGSEGPELIGDWADVDTWTVEQQRAFGYGYEFDEDGNIIN